jgi:hypoxanthine phosphoribosyltransferase
LNVLIEEKTIIEKVKNIAKKINHDYKSKKPILVGVLKGAFVFMADLLREIEIPVEIDFISVSSYNGKKPDTEIRLSSDLSLDIENRDVIVIEDIIDTGRTAHYIINTLKEKRPHSLAICTLLNKKEDRAFEVPLTYIGFNIPKAFVVGYGLDCSDNYRNLKYIGVV